jgi:nitroreductase
MPNTAEIVHKVMSERRSVRSFKTDPIPPQVLERIMTSACWAPSAMNRQPWKFFVLADEMRNRLAAIHQPLFEGMEQAIRERYGEEGVEIRRRLYANLGGAPIAIVCFTDLQEGNSKKDVVSAALACENLAIAAWSEGVASLVMTSSLTVSDEISFLCGVETKKLELVLVMLLGYAEAVPAPSERRKKRVVYASTPADIRQG